jgi:hypothetical protein
MSDSAPPPSNRRSGTTKVAVGDEVTLQLYIVEDVTAFRLAKGKVVRVEVLDAGDAGPWLRRIAVHFDEVLTVYADEIAAFRERTSKLGLSS